MGGRKNHLQGLGFVGKDLSGIEDPVERDLVFKSIQTEPFCRVCGQEILLGGDEGIDNIARHALQMQSMMHSNCRAKFEEEQRQKAFLEKKREEELRKNFDMEAYMERMMREREGK